MVLSVNFIDFVKNEDKGKERKMRVIPSRLCFHYRIDFDQILVCIFLFGHAEKETVHEQLTSYNLFLSIFCHGLSLVFTERKD